MASTAEKLSLPISSGSMASANGPTNTGMERLSRKRCLLGFMVCYKPSSAGFSGKLVTNPALRWS